MKFDVPHELYPFEHRFVDLGNRVDMHYVDEGQGETLLMLHGNPSWSFLYRKMILKLRGSFRCVAPDYPGFGLTEAPLDYGFTPGEHSQQIERFVDRLGLTDITLVMQDWGGPVGLGLAVRRPELVKRLVIGNTWAWSLVGERRNELFSWAVSTTLVWGGIKVAMLSSLFGTLILIVSSLLWFGFQFRWRVLQAREAEDNGA